MLVYSSCFGSPRRGAFTCAYNVYLMRSQAEDEINGEDDDSDDELALLGINPVALSPIKASGTKVERNLSEPLLKKSDKKTCAEF
jgi:hypothetical protein